MDQVVEFFRKLLDTADWPPRWYCGEWSEFHGWLYILSDIGIWLSYFAIPFFLLAFVYKKEDAPLPKVFWLFGAFILLCGITHLMDAVIFWWPAYRLSALLRFMTAVVSMATVVALFKLFPQALKFRTSAEFERELEHRRKAEDQLLRAQAEMEAYNQQLEVKNEEVQQLASIVSHDLKEPLQSFDSVLDLLKRQVKDPQQETTEYFDYLEESTTRMRGLITDLLDYARLGTQRQLAEVDLEQVLLHVKADLRSSIDTKEAEIIHEKFPTISGYRTELRLLFQNLLNNALKFHKEGIPPKVSIEVEEREEDWLFAVKDNGKGISPKNQQKIFMIFQTLNEDKLSEGSGIGLAHCQKIVELHKGHIWVESEPGEGSSFFFTIAKNLKQ